MQQKLVLADVLRVMDDRGRSVSLAQPASRIITLGPSITELVFAAGAGEAIVAIDNASDFPKSVTSRQRVGGLNALDLEKIIALQPELIVVWDSGYRSGVMDKLAAIATIYYADPKKIQDIPLSIEKLGILTGNQQHANQVAQQFRNDIAMLQRRYSHQPRIPAFYQVWLQPLMTVGKTHNSITL